MYEFYTVDSRLQVLQPEPVLLHALRWVAARVALLTKAVDVVVPHHGAPVLEQKKLPK